LGLIQSAFARLLGVSPRAVQSWEQGGRSPTAAAERSMLLLLLAHRNGARLAELVCWDHTQCLRERREECIVHRCRQGHLSWFMTGNACQGKDVRTWRGRKPACGNCGFMHVLLDGEEQADA